MVDRALREWKKARKEALAFAERAHRRQVMGNALTSLFQSLAANRPLQVVTAASIIDLVNLANKRLPRGAQFADALTDTALKGALAGYLLNSDGGNSIAYDVPDVEGPKVGEALPGSDAFPFSSRRSR